MYVQDSQVRFEILYRPKGQNSNKMQNKATGHRRQRADFGVIARKQRDNNA